MGSTLVPGARIPSCPLTYARAGERMFVNHQRNLGKSSRGCAVPHSNPVPATYVLLHGPYCTLLDLHKGAWE